MNELKSRDISRAILKGDIESLNNFKNLGLDFASVSEKEKWTYLHKTTQSVSLPIQIDSINFLISNNVELNSQDIYGNTALHYAARNKHKKAIDTLLKAGAKLDIKNADGITALHQTLLQKPYNKCATEVLLDAGSDISHLMKFVNTISHGDDSYIKDLFAKYE